MPGHLAAGTAPSGALCGVAAHTQKLRPLKKTVSIVWALDKHFGATTEFSPAFLLRRHILNLIQFAHETVLFHNSIQSLYYRPLSTNVKYGFLATNVALNPYEA